MDSGEAAETRTAAGGRGQGQDTGVGHVALHRPREAARPQGRRAS